MTRLTGVMPEFIRLLITAESSRNWADNFDLHSEDPKNLNEWVRRCSREREDVRNLINYVVKHHKELLTELDKCKN